MENPVIAGFSISIERHLLVAASLLQDSLPGFQFSRFSAPSPNPRRSVEDQDTGFGKGEHVGHVHLGSQSFADFGEGRNQPIMIQPHV